MPHHDNLTQEVKTKAQNLGEEAAAAARQKVEAGAEALRDHATEKTTQFANSADAAADEFDADSPQAKAAAQVAQHADDLANRLAQLDLEATTAEISRFARNNPALFLGGAALLGLAAARFLKARTPETPAPTYASDDPWGSHRGSNLTSRGATGGSFDVPS